MKTKLFTLFFALIASIGTVFAQSGTCGDNLTWNLTEGVLTISGTGDMYDFYDGVPWASYRENITSVTIGNGVTSIGYGAFHYCTNLASVTISNSVTRIGKDAFYGCSGLKDPVYNAHLFARMPKSYSGAYSIPNGIEKIIWGAFDGCTGLTSLTIPNSVTDIEGDVPFDGCSGLTSIVVGSKNTVYDSRNNCNAIIKTASNILIVGCENTIIPNGIIGIGMGAFDNRTGLTSITIPKSVEYIGYGAFDGCTGLTSITISNSVTIIGTEAFKGCTGLTSVTIPNSVKHIDEQAFGDCSGLKSVICMAVTPPTSSEPGAFYEMFGGVDKSKCKLYVLDSSMNLYKVTEIWKDFTNILPIKATDINVTDVVVEPTDNSVDIQWPTVSGAYTYELVIKDNKGNVICTLTFNAQGQLESIAFNAPKRNNAPQQTQTAGFAFTVTGLDSGTRYTATITSKSSTGSVLNTKTVSFTTTGQLQAINNVSGEAKIDGTKIIRNGQLFIQRGDEVFNVQGARVE